MNLYLIFYALFGVSVLLFLTLFSVFLPIFSTNLALEFGRCYMTKTLILYIYYLGAGFCVASIVYNLYFLTFKSLKIMSKKIKTSSDAIVTVFMKKNVKGIRFCLRYSLDGVQHRESLLEIPLVQKSDRLNFEEAKARAEAIKFERIKQIREGKLGYSTRSRKLLLKDWFAVCVERAKNHERENGNRHTWARTIEFTGEVVEQYRGGVKLVEVDKKFVMGFIDYLKNEYIIGNGLPNEGNHLMPSSAEKKLSAFSYVLKMAVSEGYIVRNPFDQIDSADKIHVPESTREYLTEDELKKTSPNPDRQRENAAGISVYVFLRIAYFGREGFDMGRC